MSYFSRLKTKLLGFWRADGVYHLEADVNAIFQAPLRVTVPAASTAATPGTAATIAPLGVAYKVVSATFVMDTGTTVAASATDYAALFVYGMDSAGSATTLVAYLTSSATPITAGVPRSLSVVGSTVNRGAMESLWYVVSKIGTGASTYAGSLEVIVERID